MSHIIFSEFYNQMSRPLGGVGEEELSMYGPWTIHDINDTCTTKFYIFPAPCQELQRFAFYTSPGGSLKTIYPRVPFAKLPPEVKMLVFESFKELEKRGG